MYWFWNVIIYITRILNKDNPFINAKIYNKIKDKKFLIKIDTRTQLEHKSNPIKGSKYVQRFAVEDFEFAKNKIFVIIGSGKRNMSPIIRKLRKKGNTKVFLVPNI